MLASTHSSKHTRPAPTFRTQSGPQIAGPLRHTNLLQHPEDLSELALVIVADDIATMDLMCRYATAMRRQSACQAILKNLRDQRCEQTPIQDKAEPQMIRWVAWGGETVCFKRDQNRGILYNMFKATDTQSQLCLGFTIRVPCD